MRNLRGGPETENRETQGNIEQDPQNQIEKRIRIDKPEEEENVRELDPRREDITDQGRGANREAPSQNTPVREKVKRIEERSKGKQTPRGTKRKKEPDIHQSRMTEYYSRREKKETSVS